VNESETNQSTKRIPIQYLMNGMDQDKVLTERTQEVKKEEARRRNDKRKSKVESRKVESRSEKESRNKKKERRKAKNGSEQGRREEVKEEESKMERRRKKKETRSKKKLPHPGRLFFFDCFGCTETPKEHDADRMECIFFAMTTLCKGT